MKEVGGGADLKDGGGVLWARRSPKSWIRIKEGSIGQRLTFLRH